METPKHKRKYSWWWDSHITPKNSKWLQENLTDMDVKLKQMIKLIEEDADSFASRAEMYYKKRPELMKLVEEFYRAYRALAERYDHAAGALHQTMAEAFPDQDPFGLADDFPAGSKADPRTPELAPARVISYPDDLRNDALGDSSSLLPALKQNGASTDGSDSATIHRGLKQLNDIFGSGEKVNHVKSGEGQSRKGLNFHNVEEKDQAHPKGIHDIKARIPSESERMGKAEMEILTLKNALAKLEAEKEADLLQYQQSLERLSNLESEVSRACEDSKGLSEQARIAEAKVNTLKEAITRLEAEREKNLLQHQQCLAKISILEKSMSHAEADSGKLSDRASKAEIEAQCLMQELARIEAEKKAAVLKCEEYSNKISDLVDKLLQAEEDVKRINDVADKAEKEVDSLKQALANFKEENEALALQYQQSLEEIFILEHRLACAEEEAQRLNSELDNGLAKLKGAEEKCLLLERSNETLHSELESMVQKMGSRNQELTQKQKELGRLWTCIQEERLRFKEGETAFQTLQHLHYQSQEELRSMATELQDRAQILNDMETRNQCLQEEVKRVKHDNEGLNALNSSSAASITHMQDEILSLSETIGKLEAEVILQDDQRNALQQEIYCLKEELDIINKKHEAMVEQVVTVSLNPENFGVSVKELQDENSRLKEVSERDRCEKVALLKKLEIMEELREKNAFLENSLTDLNGELKGAGDKVKTLEEACQNLLAEKSMLVAEMESRFTQLQNVTENLNKLSDKNNFLEKSVFYANAEVKDLRVKTKSLEDSCLLLENEKSGLTTERECLVSHLDIARKCLEDLEKSYAGLEERYFGLEKEKKSMLQKVEEVQVSLDTEKQQHADFVQLSETRLAGMESQISFLQEERRCSKQAYEEELDKAVDAQIEIFILQKYVHDLKEKNSSLVFECQDLVKKSQLSEKLIYKLKHENLEQQDEVNSLVDQIKALSVGLYQLLETLQIDADQGCDMRMEQDQTLLNHIIENLKEMKISLVRAWEENHQVVMENSILVALLGQLKLETENFVAERNTLDEQFRIQSERLIVLQIEFQKLGENNEELKMEVKERDCREEGLKAEMKSLHMELSELQESHQNLQKQNCKVLNEKESLMKKVLDLQEEKCTLEEESCVMFVDTVSKSNLSHIFKDVISEKLVQITELSKNMEKLCCINNELEEKVRLKDRKLEAAQTENLDLKHSIEKSEYALIQNRSVANQLNCDIANRKDLLSVKNEELSVANQKLSSLQNERTELHMTVEDLKCKCDEAKMVQEDQGKQILKLTEDNDRQVKETKSVNEANTKLKAEVWKLHDELDETKHREEILYHELKKDRKDTELWETQAKEFFSELQISLVCEVVLKEKAHELSRACENLEDRSDSNDMEIKQLKEKVSALEGENGGLKAQLTESIPAVISLQDSITSLETHTISHKAGDDGVKDAVLVSDMQAESCQRTSDEQYASVQDGFADSKDLQMRIKAIEQAMIEKERLAMMETLTANSKLEVAMRQIEELNCRSHSPREIGQASKRVGRKYEQEERLDNLKSQKPAPEISEEGDELLTKDIVLDQVSECSSHGLSRRGTMETDDQMLELWETTDQDGSIDLKVGTFQQVAPTPSDYRDVKAVNQQKIKQPTIESLVEKELGVVKEIPKRSSGSQNERSKTKILDKLGSDAQKLANLQITVQDLKKKVETSENGMKGKGIEYNIVKEQLEDTEEAVMKLLDVNNRLLRKTEDVFNSDEKSSLDLDGGGSVRRQKFAEQARRVSEKIGQVQLEVQKLQFLLLKLDDEMESRGRTRITERHTCVPLRDYLFGHGGSRSTKKKKKAHCFTCVRPPTRGDSSS